MEIILYMLKTNITRSYTLRRCVRRICAMEELIDLTRTLDAYIYTVSTVSINQLNSFPSLNPGMQSSCAVTRSRIIIIDLILSFVCRNIYVMPRDAPWCTVMWCILWICKPARGNKQTGMEVEIWGDVCHRMRKAVGAYWADQWISGSVISAMRDMSTCQVSSQNKFGLYYTMHMFMTSSSEGYHFSYPLVFWYIGYTNYYFNRK